MAEFQGWSGGCANRLSHASGGWNRRLSASGGFIGEIRVIRGSKILAALRQI
jgi:hypothetical protein